VYWPSAGSVDTETPPRVPTGAVDGAHAAALDTA
jgi:hypothetical protein